MICFWLAYVLTRPLGASLADWLAVSPAAGRHGGAGPVSLGLAIIILGFVAFLAITRKDVEPGGSTPRGPGDDGARASSGQLNEGSMAEGRP